MALAGSQAQHVSRRPIVQLPSKTLELGFYEKVLANIRRRRARLVAPLESTNAPCPKQECPILPMCSTEGAQTPRSKYLTMACLPRSCENLWRQVAEETSLQPISISSGPLYPREMQPLVPPLAAQIVEAPTSLTISSEEGRDEKIPPHTWLVLSSPFQDGFDLPSLSPSVGGGHIREDGSAAPLRVVTDDRHHVAAAEANFQRAARGSSVVALRHASHILEVLAQDDTAPAIAAATSPLWARRTNAEEVAARSLRLESVVASRAAAAALDRTKSTKSLASSATSSGRRSSRDLLAAALENPDLRLSGGKHLLQKGCVALQEFQTFSNRRYGNPVRVWFLLDQEANMKIGEKQFARRCLEIGFRGNIPALWRYMDSDQTGTITLTELSARSAIQLARFKRIIRERFRDCAQDAFQYLDDNHSNRVNRPEFVQKIKALGYEESASRLFDLLDRRGLGFVVASDMAFLDVWRPPPYTFCTPDCEGQQRLKAAMRELYQSPLKAWRRVLDRDSSMRISWDEFKKGCKELYRTAEKVGDATLPKTDHEIAAVWRAFDRDCSGWLGLKEFDEEAFNAVAEFKRWAERAHGGVVRAFHSLDLSKNNKLSLKELSCAGKGEDGCKGDLALLFDGLDLNNSRVLQEEDIRFLDRWDLEWEVWEASVRAVGSSAEWIPPRRNQRRPQEEDAGASP